MQLSLYQPAQSKRGGARRGGARPGAGRKPRPGRRPAPHRPRHPLSRHHPLHIVVRLAPGVPSLRTRKLFGRVHRALAAAKERFGMRIIHYSVQDNHLHLLVEVEHPDSRLRGDCRFRGDKAAAKRALTKAMQGLGVRLARRLNKVLGRRGRLIEERYHVTRLTTPRQVKNALLYILNNGRKHRAEKGPTLRGGLARPLRHRRLLRALGGARSPALPPGNHGFGSWMNKLGPKAGPRSIVAPRSWLLTDRLAQAWAAAARRDSGEGLEGWQELVAALRGRSMGGDSRGTPGASPGHGGWLPARPAAT